MIILVHLLYDGLQSASCHVKSSAVTAVGRLSGWTLYFLMLCFHDSVTAGSVVTPAILRWQPASFSISLEANLSWDKPSSSHQFSGPALKPGQSMLVPALTGAAMTWRLTDWLKTRVSITSDRGIEDGGAMFKRPENVSRTGVNNLFLTL